MKRKYFIFTVFLVLLFVYSCTDTSSSKHFDINEKVVDCKSKIKDININPIVSEITTISIFNDYLILHDLKTDSNKVTHLFNKNDFSHTTDAVFKGEGPGEITVPGELSFNSTTNDIWVSDLGKMLVCKFPLDSILSNPKYKSNQSVKLSMEKFIYKFDFLNNDNILGKAVLLQADHTIAYRIAKLNLKTDEITQYGYFPKDIKGQESEFHMKLSKNNNFYIMAFYWKDLITVCNMDGSLKFNIYGKQWQNSKKKISYFYDVDLYNNKIVCSYLGSTYKRTDKSQGEIVVKPTKLIVFDADGNYIETLDIGYEIIDFCIDKDNSRIIFYFADKEKPFGYIDYK